MVNNTYFQQLIKQNKTSGYAALSHLDFAVMALDKYVIYWGLTKSTAQCYTFFFFFQCSASLIKSLVNTSWCVFLHRDADGDSHWYDYQANAKYAISCYSSHLVIYRLQCVLVLLFCFNPLDCFFKVKTKTIPYNLNYTLAATSCWVVRDHLVQPVLLVKLSYRF